MFHTTDWHPVLPPKYVFLFCQPFFQFNLSQCSSVIMTTESVPRQWWIFTSVSLVHYCKCRPSFLFDLAFDFSYIVTLCDPMGPCVSCWLASPCWSPSQVWGSSLYIFLLWGNTKVVHGSLICLKNFRNPPVFSFSPVTRTNLYSVYSSCSQGLLLLRQYLF